MRRSRLEWLLPFGLLAPLRRTQSSPGNIEHQPQEELDAEDQQETAPSPTSTTERMVPDRPSTWGADESPTNWTAHLEFWRDLVWRGFETVGIPFLALEQIAYETGGFTLYLIVRYSPMPGTFVRDHYAHTTLIRARQTGLMPETLSFAEIQETYMVEFAWALDMVWSQILQTLRNNNPRYQATLGGWMRIPLPIRSDSDSWNFGVDTALYEAMSSIRSMMLLWLSSRFTDNNGYPAFRILPERHLIISYEMS